MDVKEIKRLIVYHQDGLNQYRQHISLSAQYLEEQTIGALKELLQYKAVVSDAAAAIRKSLDNKQ